MSRPELPHEGLPFTKLYEHLQDGKVTAGRLTQQGHCAVRSWQGVDGRLECAGEPGLSPLT